MGANGLVLSGKERYMASSDRCDKTSFSAITRGAKKTAKVDRKRAAADDPPAMILLNMFRMD